MPKVIFDYGKCKGSGDCVENCPLELLELSKTGKWCKPKDEKVENKDAVQEFYDKVDGKENGQVEMKIEFELPECVECLVCETACPEEAIKIGES